MSLSTRKLFSVSVRIPYIFAVLGTYDLVICIGSLMSTHINEGAFEEMIRITKPGKTAITRYRRFTLFSPSDKKPMGL